MAASAVHQRSGAAKSSADETSGTIDHTMNNNGKDLAAAPDNKKMMRVAFLGLLIDLLAFTLILPLLPSLLDHYRRAEYAAAGASPGLYARLESAVKTFGSAMGAPERFIPVLFGGLVGSLFSFLQFLASPAIGGLSDVYGRRPALLATTLGVLLSYVLWGLSSESFALFVLARVVGGLSKGNVSLYTAVMADVSSDKGRQTGMALVGVAFSLGFILGPMMGAAFFRAAAGSGTTFSPYPAWVAAFLAALDLAFLWACYEETLPPRKLPVASSRAKLGDYVNPVALFNFAALRGKDQPRPGPGQTSKDLDPLVMSGRAYFVYLFLYSGLEFTLTFLTHLRFGFTSAEQGQMFAFVGILMAAIQGGYVRRVPPGKEKSVALFGLLLLVPSFTLVGFAGSRALLYAGLALYAASTAVVVPCLTTMVSKYGSPDQRGTIMGVFRSLGALGRALGPVAASVLYWIVGPEICYSVGGVGLILPYLMLRRVP